MKQLIILFTLLILFFGCTSNGNDNNNITNPPINGDINQVIINPPVASGLVGFSELDDSKLTIQALNDLILANNSFAVDYYNKLDSSKDQSGKNIFFSPFSISTSLAMTYEGADGVTAEEMRKVLYFSENDTERRAAFANVYNNLNKSASKGNYTINIANALWNEITYPFKQSFYDTIENYYYGKSTPVDFNNAPEEQRQKINLWVENQTNKKIIELLPKNSILEDTRMVLVNAIYFKGDWNNKFDEKNTYGGEFSVNENTKKDTQMMYQKNEFNYYEDDSFQYVELPYKGEDMSMIVLLPKENYVPCGAGTNDCVNPTNNVNYNFIIPSASEITELKTKMSTQKIEVHLPKFKFRTNYQMKKDLQEMGLKEAFTNFANFSKMDEQNYIKIDEIYHQAFVEVNEEGTEAAAATAVVVIQKTSMPAPSPIFNANHPFFFYIQDNVSGEILFLGKIVDPTLE
ncbi:MAG TPA: serpin family protein [archaeon]|nr:serpin family protein [archaeon]